MNSRAKGQRGERELADFLTAAGFPARRGQQFAGGPDSPDVVCPGLPFHIEAKRTERLNLDAACAQAHRDAAGRPWAVFHRRNRTGWRVTLDASAFLAIVSRAHTRAMRPESPVALACAREVGEKHLAVSTLAREQNAATGQPEGKAPPSDNGSTSRTTSREAFRSRGLQLPKEGTPRGSCTLRADLGTVNAASSDDY